MAESSPAISASLRVPRITIEFCVQCKWNLRAAYFAQELLQTFSTSIGEISLIPVTGGVFKINLFHNPQQQQSEAQDQHMGSDGGQDQQQQQPEDPVTIQETLIWDRKRDGGFPETKELKNRVRNILEPGKDMGHVDRALKKGKEGAVAGASAGVEKAKEIPDAEASKQASNGGGLAEVEQSAADTKQPPADCEDCK